MPPITSKKGLTVNEALDIIFGPDSDEEDCNVCNVAIEPPIEDPEADTDQDSDKSDDEVVGISDHLPRRVLATTCEIRKYKAEDDMKQDMEENISENQVTECSLGTSSVSEPKVKRGRFKKNISKMKKKEPLKWTKSQKLIGSKIPNYIQSSTNNPDSNINSPLQSLQKFLTSELIDYIVEQSLLYAVQKHYRTEVVTKENILSFVGILLVSGYNKLPDRRMYWSVSPDVHNILISNSMRRDTFDEIMRCLHLANNMEMNEDRFYKVRPIFNCLNKACKNLNVPEYLSVDEAIVPYYGHHGLKQFIKGKPIRFGFKLWVLCSSNGLLLHTEPYCGASTNLPESGLGQGSDVVLGLIDKCKIPKGSHVVMDNLFTSIPLLKELSRRGIAATGTLRENRQQNAPLPSKDTLKKAARGTYEDICHEDIVIVKWNDNTVVTIASNKVTTKPIASAIRWSGKDKKKITVPMPQQLKFIISIWVAWIF